MHEVSYTHLMRVQLGAYSYAAPKQHLSVRSCVSCTYSYPFLIREQSLSAPRPGVFELMFGKQTKQ